MSFKTQEVNSSSFWTWGKFLHFFRFQRYFFWESHDVVETLPMWKFDGFSVGKCPNQSWARIVKGGNWFCVEDRPTGAIKMFMIVFQQNTSAFHGGNLVILDQHPKPLPQARNHCWSESASVPLAPRLPACSERTRIRHLKRHLLAFNLIWFEHHVESLCISTRICFQLNFS